MSDGKKQHENEDRRLAPLTTGAASAVGDAVKRGNGIWNARSKTWHNGIEGNETRG